MNTPNSAWRDRPYQLKNQKYTTAERGWCPICYLLRGEEVKLRLVGRRYPPEDRPLECPACHRTWWSARYFMQGWLPAWIPQIHKELHDASGIDGRNDASYQEGEEREWDRMQQVKQAVDAGTWTPKNPDTLQMPTAQQMEHFSPERHTPTWARKSPLSSLE